MTVGKKEGLVKLIEDDATTTDDPHSMKYHCIRNQEKLCAKALKMDNVIKAVNFVQSRGLNHLQFEEFIVRMAASKGKFVSECED